MKDYIIVDEYLYNLYDYAELANHLGIEEKEVKRVLQSVKGPIARKVIEHSNIISYLKNPDESLKETNPLVEKIGEYIVKNDASYKDASKVFGLSAKTICIYMNKKLYKCSTKLYKDVFETVKRHKETTIETTERREILQKEIMLLEQNYTLKEIADALGLSYSRVQRDLAYSSKLIDPDLNESIKARLYLNQKMSNEFKNKNF